MGVSYLRLPHRSLGDGGERADVPVAASLTRLIFFLDYDTWRWPLAAAPAVGKRALYKPPSWPHHGVASPRDVLSIEA